MAKIVLTREDLYRQSWAKPATRLAEAYGISDVAFAKLCRRRNIPRPPRGYWAQLAAGRKLPIPRLPSPQPGEDREVIFDPETRAARRLSVTPRPLSRVLEPVPLPPAPRSLASGRLHPMAERLKNFLFLLKPAANGLVHIEEKGLPAVRASAGQALRISQAVHTLVSAAQTLNVSVEAKEKDAGGVLFRRGSRSAGLSIDELLGAIASPGAANSLRASKADSASLSFQLNLRWTGSGADSIEQIVESMLRCLTAVFEEKPAELQNLRPEKTAA